jgi:hypothetical protein
MGVFFRVLNYFNHILYFLRATGCGMVERIVCFYQLDNKNILACYQNCLTATRRKSHGEYF